MTLCQTPGIRKQQQHIAICNHTTLLSEIRRKSPMDGLEWFNVSKPLSLSRDLRGKVVVLDFFTYCCVNCLHILPQLKQLEEQCPVEEGVVVIGVHSAKFDNEKDSANILAAVQRYNISHPVVNDADGTMWHSLGIPCWPTLLILGPNGEALFLLVGESHKHDMFLYVQTALNYYKNEGQIKDHSLPITSQSHIAAEEDRSLLFPGKMACCELSEQNNNSSQNGNNHSGENYTERLAVSDTGHHRIIIFSTSGRIEYVIGGPEPGFVDGAFNEAQFNSPQGLTFHNPNLLYIADTENHAIREINLRTLHVRTLVGTGVQGTDHIGGARLVNQIISSPWDLCLVSSKLLKEPLAPENETAEKDVLLIAMAGLHQIWAFFLSDAVWWKGKMYEAGTCAAIVGTGKEENRNNSYPHAAAFAQPSGLCVVTELQSVFVADSESSSIRRIYLNSGKVAAVVGGDRNPSNLFGFGDQDGKQYDAKLQHPLGVAWNSHNKMLYVADSYNHKLKSINVQTNNCTTVLGTSTRLNSRDAVQLNEPGGLCVSSDGTHIYVADTNNHCIKIVNLETMRINKLIMFLPREEDRLGRSKKSGTVVPTELTINSSGGEITLVLSVTLDEGISLTANAPQKWVVEFPGPSWSASRCAGDYEPETTLKIMVPKQKQASSATFSINYRLYICRDSSECSKLELHIVVTVVYSDLAPDTVIHHFTHAFGQHRM
ncbi:NHL repeat-containing protein 2 isoform X2 [Periplaneta americana]|uniref:NHL repeat-containing protein 2 isoform X2 n=1 Tax=Periplaneta americana TaxID=6978 RepID=UPI0037E75113